MWEVRLGFFPGSGIQRRVQTPANALGAAQVSKPEPQNPPFKKSVLPTMLPRTGYFTVLCYVMLYDIACLFPFRHQHSEVCLNDLLMHQNHPQT